MYGCQAVVNYKILEFVAANYVSFSLAALAIGQRNETKFLA